MDGNGRPQGSPLQRRTFGKLIFLGDSSKKETEFSTDPNSVSTATLLVKQKREGDFENHPPFLFYGIPPLGITLVVDAQCNMQDDPTLLCIRVVIRPCRVDLGLLFVAKRGNLFIPRGFVKFCPLVEGAIGAAVGFFHQ
jgi:hypothetical protein